MSSIDRVNINNAGIDRSQQVKGTEAVSGVGKEQTSSFARQDTVELSSTAREIDRIADLVNQARQERLEQVRGMLDSGTYQVSGADIAKKLIESQKL